jgi:hypothetical protein
MARYTQKKERKKKAELTAVVIEPESIHLKKKNKKKKT